MNRLVAFALTALIVGGCAETQSEAVRNRDLQRVETAKTMPGNDIPQDPADLDGRPPAEHKSSEATR